MPRKRPPFVELWRDRHGKVRVYFRKAKGPRLPLPSDITSEEFTAAYQAALAGQLALIRLRQSLLTTKLYRGRILRGLCLDQVMRLVAPAAVSDPVHQANPRAKGG